MCTDVIFENHEIFHYGDCKFDRSNFRKLLGFAMRGNHFMLDGKIYEQIDGVAMGSPPQGPSLANLFMCFLENRYLNDCPSQFKPVLNRRYVDDTFCLFKDKSEIYFF